MDIGAVNKGKKVSPKKKARARAKVRATRAQDSPKAKARQKQKAKSKTKSHEPKNNEIKPICTADRAPVKSHTSQGHVERAVVDNQYRAVLFDAQERRKVEIDPVSTASAWILRHFVWLLNRYQPHKGGATSFGKPGGVLVVANGAPRTFRSMWVGRTKKSDENLQLLRISSLMLTTLKSKIDGLRRQDARRVSQHTEKQALGKM